MSEPQTEVEVPKNVYTHCPLKEFRLRPVLDCETCPHFRGLADRAPTIAEFRSRYLVLCAGEPTKRQIHEVS